MKSKKIRKAILIAVVCIFILAGAGLVVMYYIGDRILNEAIDAELASIDEQLDSEDLLNQQDAGANENSGAQAGGIAEGAPADKPEEGGNASEDASQSTQSGNTVEKNGNESGAETSVSGKSRDDTEKDMTGSVSGNSSDNTSNSATDRTPNPSGKTTDNPAVPDKNEPSATPLPVDTDDAGKKMTVQEIAEIKDKVTATDKIEAAALLLKRLGRSDIDTLKKMLDGGVTEAEKNEAKQIVYDKFSEEEVEKIKEIYRKYMYE